MWINTQEQLRIVKKYIETVYESILFAFKEFEIISITLKKVNNEKTL